MATAKPKKLKVYRLGANGLHYLSHGPALALLREHGLPEHIHQVTMVTAGVSKTDALSLLNSVGQRPTPADVKLGMGNDLDALAEASLLPEDGQREGSWWPGVIAYAQFGFDGTPVVVLRPEYEDGPRVAGWWRRDAFNQCYVEVTGE